MEYLFESFLNTFSIYVIGLHMLVALFFAVHAMRTGQPMYWLWVLFVFLLLGSVVYFFAIYLPNSRLESALRSGSSEAMKILNPGRELRDARRAYELTPSLHHQMRVASALLSLGKTAEAVTAFDACLARAPASDLDVRLAAAEAKVVGGQAEQAVVLLREIREQNDAFRVQDVTLLSARALAATGKNDAARAQFEYLVNHFGGFEARVEHAVWLASQGDVVAAKAAKAEIDKTIAFWPRHSKYLNKPLIKRLNKAFSQIS